METKDNMLSETEGLPEMESNQTDSGEKLREELEEVRALFEETLKNETDKANNPDSEAELIQPLEDIDRQEDEEANVPENTRECACCGEELPEESFSEGREYCDSCYGAMKKYPLRARGFITCLVMAVAFFAAIFTAVTSVVNFEDASDTSYEYYFYAMEDYSLNRTISAVNGYTRYLAAREDGDSVSMTAVKHTIDCYDRMGAYAYAAELIEEHFTDAQLKLPWNARYRKIIELNEMYNTTYNKIVELSSSAVTEDGYDFEKLIGDTLALKEETDEEGNRLYADFVIDIYTFDYMTMADYSDEELFSFISEIDEKYGEQENSHLTSLCRYAAITGRKDVADECFDRMMEINSQNIDMYSAYFNYYRFLETPDTEKMKEITDKMATICGELSQKCGIYNMDYLYNRTITCLLTGEGSMAMEAMNELQSAVNYYGSYYSGTYTTSTVNLYALTCLYNGNTEGYESAKTLMEQSGHKLSDLVEKYKDEKITIAEALTDKGGDIA